jgi:nucleoside ABC transporter membrane protein
VDVPDQCRHEATRGGRVAQGGLRARHPGAAVEGSWPAWRVARLVGLAGAAYSLAVKPGWGRPQGCEGAGWIALAIVIFGGWHPVRAAIGAYFFAALQVSGIYLQDIFPSIPAQVFQVAPFPMMIITLAVNLGRVGFVQDLMRRYPFLKRFSAAGPSPRRRRWARILIRRRGCDGQGSLWQQFGFNV